MDKEWKKTEQQKMMMTEKIYNDVKEKENMRRKEEWNASEREVVFETKPNFRSC
jgi:hypothetical protein